MSRQPSPAGDGHGEPTVDDALIVSLETLLANARTQLGELRSTLATAIDFARAQDHLQ